VSVVGVDEGEVVAADGARDRQADPRRVFDVPADRLNPTGMSPHRPALLCTRIYIRLVTAPSSLGIAPDS